MSYPEIHKGGTFPHHHHPPSQKLTFSMIYILNNLYIYSTLGVLSLAFRFLIHTFFLKISGRVFDEYFPQISKTSKCIQNPDSNLILHRNAYFGKNQSVLSLKKIWRFPCTLFLTKIGRTWCHSDIIYSRPIKTSKISLVKMCKTNKGSNSKSLVAISTELFEVLKYIWTNYRYHKHPPRSDHQIHRCIEIS